MKIETIVNVPSNMANYLAKHLPEMELQWMPIDEETFDKLRELLTKAPILLYKVKTCLVSRCQCI